MTRPAARFTSSFGRASGSAAVARERLRGALHTDRAAVRGGYEPRATPRAEAIQPDLLDLLLSQSAAPCGGRP